MTTQSRREAVAHLDPVLGPVAAAHRTSPPARVVMALAARAHSAGIDSGSLRLWTRLTLPGPVADLTYRDALYGRLCSAASSHAKRGASLNGRAKMRTAAARRIVGHLFSPLPPRATLTPRTEPIARAALVVLGREFLARAESDGFDTVVLSAPDLALALGCSLPTAHKALTRCVEAGWVRRMPQRRGAPARWKLSRLDPASDAVAWEHADLVDALAAGDDTHPLAEVLATVSHPSIGYGAAPLGHRAWWEGLLAVAEAEAEETLTAPDSPVRRRHRRAWLAVTLGTEADASEPLTLTLDRLAASTGAVSKRTAAAVARRERAADRTAEIARVRAERERVRTGLGRLWNLHPIPHVRAPAPVRDAWLAAVLATLATSPPEPHLRPYLARQVEHALTARHYRADIAAKVAARLVGLPAGPAQAA